MNAEYLMRCKRPDEEAIYDASRVDGVIQVSHLHCGSVIAKFATTDQFNAEFDPADLPKEFMLGTVTADFLKDVGPIDCYSDGRGKGLNTPAFGFVEAMQLVDIFQARAAERDNGVPAAFQFFDEKFQAYDWYDKEYHPCSSSTKEIDGKSVTLWHLGEGLKWDEVQLKTKTPAKRPSL
jgi:hypothetical protein